MLTPTTELLTQVDIDGEALIVKWFDAERIENRELFKVARLQRDLTSEEYYRLYEASNQR